MPSQPHPVAPRRHLNHTWWLREAISSAPGGSAVPAPLHLVAPRCQLNQLLLGAISTAPGVSTVPFQTHPAAPWARWELQIKEIKALVGAQRRMLLRRRLKALHCPALLGPMGHLGYLGHLLERGRRDRNCIGTARGRAAWGAQVFPVRSLSHDVECRLSSNIHQFTRCEFKRILGHSLKHSLEHSLSIRCVLRKSRLSN